jgi:dipeptidyl aminopeptidase/acylaminoacyl peptidase
MSIRPIHALDQGGWAAFHAVVEHLTPSPQPTAAPCPSSQAQVLRRAEWDGLPAVAEAVSPDGRMLLTEVDHDLALRQVGSGVGRRLTDTGTADQPWRANAQVYSLLPSGPVWSPDSLRIVATWADLSEVPRRSFVDWLGGARASRSDRIPTESSPHRGLGRVAFIEVDSGDTTWAALPAAVHWTPVRWLDDGRHVIALGVDLAGELWLSRVDSHSGAAATLVRERVPGVFPYLATVLSAVATPLPGSNDVLWTSDRDGDLRLYRVAADGVRAVTPEGVQVERVVAAPDDAIQLLCRSDPDAPYDVQLGSVETGGSFRITDPHPLPAYLDMGGEPVVVTAADGVTDLHGVLFTPPGFSPRRRYPVIDCIYGGPQTIAHRCRHDAPTHHLWGCSCTVAASLAALGFVTLVLDARGTPGRGRAFQWPDAPDREAVVVADHSAALHALARTRPWMDVDRCGAIGTSFGAYHAVQAGRLAPDLFRAVVAHAGPYRPSDALPGWFPGVLGATLEEDPDLYRDVDLTSHARELATELLLIHGTDDANVTLDHTVRLSEALNQAGRHHELMLLAGQRHHLDDVAGVLALERAGRFFQHHLGRPATTR